MSPQQSTHREEERHALHVQMYKQYNRCDRNRDGSALQTLPSASTYHTLLLPKNYVSEGGHTHALVI